MPNLVAGLCNLWEIDYSNTNCLTKQTIIFNITDINLPILIYDWMKGKTSLWVLGLGIYGTSYYNL